jgi:hypothetical protein
MKTPLQRNPITQYVLDLGVSADEQPDTSQPRHAFLAFLDGISGMLRHIEAGRIEASGLFKSLHTY